MLKIVLSVYRVLEEWISSLTDSECILYLKDRLASTSQRVHFTGAVLVKSEQGMFRISPIMQQSVRRLEYVPGDTQVTGSEWCWFLTRA
jgi:hypothetical protein